VNKAFNPKYNHFTDPELSLVFELKAQGAFDSGLCDPTISLTGGYWGSGGWSGHSNAVKIEHDVIDYGEVSSAEYRQVVIPMSRFSEGTGWDLSSVRLISVNYCPELGLHSAGVQVSLCNLVKTCLVNGELYSLVSVPAPQNCHSPSTTYAICK